MVSVVPVVYTVMNRIDVPAGRAAAFEEVFAASMDRTLHGVVGLLGARLLRPRTADAPYVAVMEFTSEDAFTAWKESESFRAAHGGTSGGAGQGAAGVVEAFDTVAAVGA